MHSYPMHDERCGCGGKFKLKSRYVIQLISEIYKCVDCGAEQELVYVPGKREQVLKFTQWPKVRKEKTKDGRDHLIITPNIAISKGEVSNLG